MLNGKVLARRYTKKFHEKHTESSDGAKRLHQTMSNATSELNQKERTTRMGRKTIFLFLVTGKKVLGMARTRLCAMTDQSIVVLRKIVEN